MLRLPVLASLLSAVVIPAAAADSCRIVLLEIPKGQAAAVASELGAGKSGDASVMDALLKKRGLKAIVDKSKGGGCWNSTTGEQVDGKILLAPQSYEEDLAQTTFGSRRPHESKVKIVAEKTAEGVRELVAVEHSLLDAKERAIETLEVKIGSLWLQPGRWQELCRVSNARTEVAVWQFGMADGISSAAPAGNRVVEMKLFPASAADVAQLAKATPASRENAMTWLANRAKPWRELRYSGLVTPATSCTIIEKHYEDRRNPGPQAGSQLRVSFEKPDGKPDEAGTVSLGIGDATGDAPANEVKAEMDAGVWNFTPITGRDFANLAAWRVIK
ncbi:hypothetical protein KBB96_10985 [Luteolibacter ambystomatis]|uniref:Uncharacterized protein n=1 Tax=Luteolibacter ambystomatis TaxID=2824561 RepID=A0A975IXJ7_9BACT|nr:hypothetical protein [Luteolibacter ambystomatis]QUE49396.1 hypothetical protein KBB96_10985 [Luteolibacter ambystomatis]